MKKHLNDLLQKQRGLCWLCEEPMLRWPRNHPLAWSIDHVHPKSAGGSGSNKNMLLAHRDCNMRRSSAIVTDGVPVEKFRQAILSRLAVVDRRKERFRAAA